MDLDMVNRVLAEAVDDLCEFVGRHVVPARVTSSTTLNMRQASFPGTSLYVDGIDNTSGYDFTKRLVRKLPRDVEPNWMGWGIMIHPRDIDRKYDKKSFEIWNRKRHPKFVRLVSGILDRSGLKEEKIVFKKRSRPKLALTRRALDKLRGGRG